MPMKIFKYQLWNLFFLGGLLFLLDGVLKKEPSLLVGEFRGLSTYEWMVAAVLVPMVHQFYVVLAWRAELYYHWVSKTFGKRGFPLFKVGFAILILLRPVTITCLAVANRDSFETNNAIIFIVAGLLLIPSVYLFYSVKTYFGIDKAFGMDHFKPKEVSHERSSVCAVADFTHLLFG